MALALFQRHLFRQPLHLEDVGVGVALDVAEEVAVDAFVRGALPLHGFVAHDVVRFALLCEGADLDRLRAVGLPQGEEFLAHAQSRVVGVVVRPAHEVIHGVEVVGRVVEGKHQRAALARDGEPPHGEGAFRALVLHGVLHGEGAVVRELDVQRVIQPLRGPADESAARRAFLRLDGDVVGGVGLEVFGRLPDAVSAVEIPRRPFAVVLVEEFAAFADVALEVLVHEIEVLGAEPDDARPDVQRHHHFDSAALEHGAFAVVFIVFGLHFSAGTHSLALPDGFYDLYGGTRARLCADTVR